MDTTYNSVCNYLLNNKLEFQSLNCGPAGKVLVVPGIPEAGHTGIEFFTEHKIAYLKYST
jgi:hypothetical protein